VLDQRRLAGPVLVDGKRIQPDGGNAARVVHNFTGPATLLHGGVGYVFDCLNSSAQLSISSGDRTGNWSAISTSTQGVKTVPLLAAWIRHSPQHLNESIEYTAFPGVQSKAELLQQKKAVGLKTLKNEPDAMGVWDSRNQVVYGVFWSSTDASETGEVALKVPQIKSHPLSGLLCITSSQPIIFIAHLDAWDVRKWTVTVADPTQKLTAATIQFKWTGIPPLGWGLKHKKVVVVNFPSGGNAGSSVTVEVA